MKRVAIISPYFPPSTLAGVHRSRLLAKHLSKYCWEPVIFCVHESHHEESLDPELAKLVPSSVRVIKTDAIPIKLTRPIGVGDISLRSYWCMRRALEKFLTEEKIDVLFITMSPFYSSLMGPHLKRCFNIPLVLDYQDPWVSKFGATLPLWSKGGLSHCLATWLEPQVIRWVDHVTSVSEGTNAEIMERYPKLNQNLFSAIPIGGDSEDFEYLRSHPRQIKNITLDSKELNFSYVGTLLPKAGDTLRALLRAIAQLRQSNPTLYGKMRFNFVGTSNQPDGSSQFKVLQIAREEGVEERVREIPERLPYLDALSVLSASHVVLMLGSDERHYTASKLYPGLLSGRPVLALFHEASSVCEVIARTGGARLVSYSEKRHALSKVNEIAEACKTLAEHPESIPPASLEAMQSVLANSIAGQFADIFDRVAADGPGRAHW